MKSITGIVGGIIFAGLLVSTFADAKGSGGRSHSSGHGSNDSYSHSHSSGSRAVTGVSRDSHGRIARSSSARSDFQQSNPCPSTGKTSGACPGYVVDLWCANIRVART